MDRILLILMFTCLCGIWTLVPILETQSRLDYCSKVSTPKQMTWWDKQWETKDCERYLKSAS